MEGRGVPSKNLGKWEEERVAHHWVREGSIWHAVLGQPCVYLSIVNTDWQSLSRVSERGLQPFQVFVEFVFEWKNKRVKHLFLLSVYY